MSSTPLLTILCGGLGGARLAAGLSATGLVERSVFVTNVADDIEVDGLLVCPDTDAVLYSLGGLFDEDRGWGIRGDVFHPAGGSVGSWFSIGERDRQHHERRAALLACGVGLTAATSVLATELEAAARVLPVTEDRVRTSIRVGQSWLTFQEWLVRDQACPLPDEVRYEGVGSAKATPEVITAIEEAALVVIASSSPVASIAPMLAVPGVREALGARSGHTVVLSPVAARLPLVNERDKRRAFARAQLLAAGGVEHTPVAVAGLYTDVGDLFVLDPVDEVDADAVAATGLSPLVCPVTGQTVSDRTRLAARLGALASELRVAGR